LLQSLSKLFDLRKTSFEIILGLSSLLCNCLLSVKFFLKFFYLILKILVFLIPFGLLFASVLGVFVFLKLELPDILIKLLATCMNGSKIKVSRCNLKHKGFTL
jgi:hypothetical protein